MVVHCPLWGSWLPGLRGSGRETQRARAPVRVRKQEREQERASKDVWETSGLGARQSSFPLNPKTSELGDHWWRGIFASSNCFISSS
jgi:hypothetical protein